MSPSDNLKQLNKADCIVEYEEASSLELKISTKTPDLLEKGLRDAMSETLIGLGITRGRFTLTDDGSLDYVVAARIEAAVRTLMPGNRRLAPMLVDRRPTPRDLPRITRLYAPGNSPRLLTGVELHGADSVLLDLEDSVPPDFKLEARILVKHLLGAIEFPEVWVRINPLEVCGREDLEEVMLCKPHGICLPKAETEQDIEELAHLLTLHEERLGLEHGSTHIIPIIETPVGVMNAYQVAKASPRVVVMAFGAEDYTRELGARRTDASLLMARSQIVAAAAAARILCSDTVFSNVEDEEGLIREANLARDLGFDGKGAINPRQLGPITRAFMPTEKEVDLARRMVEAAAEAEGRGIGAVAVDGKMVDRPVLERARRVLAQARKKVEVTL